MSARFSGLTFTVNRALRSCARRFHRGVRRHRSLKIRLSSVLTSLRTLHIEHFFAHLRALGRILLLMG